MSIDSIQTLRINRMITDLTLRYGKRDYNLGYLDISYLEAGNYVAVYVEDYDKDEYRFLVYRYENEAIDGNEMYEQWMATSSNCENMDFKRLYQSVEKGAIRKHSIDEEDSWYEDFVDAVAHTTTDMNTK